MLLGHSQLSGSLPQSRRSAADRILTDCLISSLQLLSFFFRKESLQCSSSGCLMTPHRSSTLRLSPLSVTIGLHSCLMQPVSLAMPLALIQLEHLSFSSACDASFPLLTVSSSTAPGLEHSILETLVAIILLLY
jgi:hypothetical protein